jgi:putative tryptophan/tyrosine transport system substrate-binding protein
MRRRDLVLALPLPALIVLKTRPGHSQQPLPVRRIGVLMPFARADRNAQRWLEAFKQGLQSLGWTEGRNLSFDIRFSEGNPETLAALAASLVGANLDVIVTWAAQPIDALKAATRTIPIVMAGVGDALAGGYIQSLARPGGNITGLTLMATDQTGKRLELLQQMVSGLVRVTAIWNAGASGHIAQMRDLPGAAQKLSITLQSLPVRTVDDIEPALKAAVQASAQAIYLMEDPMIQSRRGQIIEFAIRQRLPLVGEFRPVAEAGGLMSYGPDQLDMWRRTASYVDKILKGAKAADLPVEQPIKFDFVINMKTANAIGLTVPVPLIVFSTELIE